MRRQAVVIGLLLLVTAAEAADRRPRILLSNDDGIEAPGLLAAYAELARVGEVTVAAPAENQSGVGHGITYVEPIMVNVIEPLVRGEGGQGPWYRIAARPATCVRLALTSLLPQRPDLVVSGINRGDNAGLTIYISGTLGAAREAAFDGIPAVAASLVSSTRMDYAPGAAVVARIASEVLKRGLPPGTFLSVNVPAVPIRGIKVVPHSLKAGVDRYERRESPRHEVYYWNLWAEPVDPDPQTDVGAIREGFVAVTPLRIEVNDRGAIAALEAWGLR
ncbi:MAG TPA: 5'/3'-nucleotidase SurE [Vicinamibacteria bacterium]|jgi:5'-nucleotidase|nr:5'/3'-nucleotidase SurE [Vicinamibacteria bacterium]